MQSYTVMYLCLQLCLPLGHLHFTLSEHGTESMARLTEAKVVAMSSLVKHPCGITK
jgi:hypothetical protein